MSTPKRQTITDEPATRFQYEDIYYLAGLKGADEKKLSEELFGVNFSVLTYSQAEQMLERLRALPRRQVGHTHPCITCENPVTCTRPNCTKEMAEHIHCRHGMSAGEFDRTYAHIF